MGKCSLTVALPIISAAGIEVSVIPTAVLSTPTGGFENFTYRDLTDDILPVAEHLRSTGAEFDAFYSGFLGSFRQIDIVSRIFDRLKNENTLIIVDPVIGDNGSLYSVFDDKFPAEMKKLCGKADIIVPNVTEAVFMLGDEYIEGPYTEKYINDLLIRLSDIGPSKIVITGVHIGDNKLGVASYDRDTGKTDYILGEKIEGFYHGTGDIFASVFTAGVMKGLSVSEAAHIAADFTSESILRTKQVGTDRLFGINFEAGLSTLAGRIENALHL